MLPPAGWDSLGKLVGWPEPMAEPTFLGIKLLRSIVISTVAQWSGEISLLNGTNRIVTGDLSTLILNRARYFFLHIDMQLRSR